MGRVEPLPTDAWVNRKSKKNTKIWCKGVEGRYHQLEIREGRWGYGSKCGMSWDIWPWSRNTGHHRARRPNEWVCSHELYCTNCGKVMHAQKFRCPDQPENL